MWSGWPKRKTWILAAVIAAVAAGAGGAVFMFSGLYNVGADVRHFRITEYIIRLTLHRSVAHHVQRDAPPALEAPGLKELGARYFEFGCTPCHGSPERDAGPIASSMYPAPPSLHEALLEWTVNEQHWIVQHGLKFTGMPAWAGRDREREVWALVAFLQDIPGMTRNEYEAMLGRQSGADASGTNRVAFCAGCHGDEDTPPVSGLVPSLNGQPYPYLVRTLQDYAADKRQSGMMEPIAARLTPEDADRIARLYSGFEPIATTADEFSPKVIEVGRNIAESGLPEKGTAPCSACHNSRASPQFPRLAGLSRNYIVEQLLLWAEGQRVQTGYGKIMQRASSGLALDEMNAVAAFYAAQSADSGKPADGKAANRLGDVR